MMDEQKYTEIYSVGTQKFMYLKEEGRYSFLLREHIEEKKWNYTEIIVAAQELEDAIEMPSSYETTAHSKIMLLFSNYDGLKHLEEFCELYDIDMKHLFWEEEN